jgi:hypothetical protein
MARLPRRLSASSAPALQPVPILDEPARPLDRGASASDPDGPIGRDPRRHGQPGPSAAGRVEEEVAFDAAVEAMLAAGGVDPVTRVGLGEARRALAQAAQGRDSDGFAGASLSRALFRFVMPRLRHPEVLRAERHRALLEALADGLAGTDDDGIVRDGALVVHRELRRLALLRVARNALVEG